MGRIEQELRVGIVGCGLIGDKRAQALKGGSLVACYDVVPAQAQRLAAKNGGAKVAASLIELLSMPEIDVVIVATVNAHLAAISIQALQAGKHVLVEKPAGCRVDEAAAILVAAREADRLVRVGFNHRYHKAIRQAREVFQSGELGDLMFIRARYGHGGRKGYDQEWRANPALSGGGELIDQGVHLIDLARWFLGEFDTVSGVAQTCFWNMPVDDNAFMILKTKRDQVAFLHASCTEWKNTFSFEIFGRDAKLHVEGLGGSYGVERLAYYKMLPQMGPPETTIWEYPMADDSWHVEFEEFLEDIRLQRQPAVGLGDAIAALTVVQQIYALSKYDNHPKSS